MAHKRLTITTLLVVASAVSGCQSGMRAPDYSSYDAAMYGATPYYMPQTPVAAAGAPPAMAQPQVAQTQSMEAIEPAAGLATQQVSALTAENTQLKDRLQRVERAMLRLDRRMQLVERNELGRMGSGTPSGQVSMTMQEEQQAMQTMEIGPSGQMPQGYAGGFQPVSAEITSGLQAASRSAQGATPVRLASNSGALPSLADVEPAVGREPKNEDIAIWTVKYEPEKVWPDRAQLPASREVVEALREGKPVTVFARGSKPNSVEFRDRVKAISRYLGKVSSVESVAIAAMPAPHLDDDTIEIFAAH